MRLLFMGTPVFAKPTLEALVASRHSLVAVITQPDRPAGRGERGAVSPIKKLAVENHIALHQPERLKAESWKATFDSLDVDGYVVVAYGKLLPSWMINLPRFGAINLHASLLPRYRGAAPIHWAIANGETETGVTTMRIDAGMDTGDILLQKAVSIGPDETISELQDRMAALGASLVLRTLDLLEQGALTPVPQNPELATYAPMLKKSDGELQWRLPVSDIYNRVRAFNPWPGTYTYLQGSLLRVWNARPVDVPPRDAAPGLLWQHETDGALVSCGRGCLQLQEVQVENRKRISGLDFLHGIRLRANQTVQLG